MTKPVEPLIPNLDIPRFEEHGAPPCSETYPDAFFAEEIEDLIYRRPDGTTYAKVASKYHYEKEAKAVCAACPYKAACLAYAVNDPSLHGIWGGATENQRRLMRRVARIKLEGN